jgi:iron complex transport system substrate-binding protein
MGQLLARVGAANVVPGALGPFPKLNPEFIVRADPQVVMISDRTSGDLSARPGWSGLRALREGRVCRFTPAQSDVLVRPGPRMAEGARLMVACIQGRLPAGRS